MAYYKIINNNSIIDVNNIFYKVQRKPRMVVPCEPKECEYVVSSDGNTLYYSAWTRASQYPISVATYVDVIELIDEKEYLKLKEELQVNQKPIEYIEVQEPVIEEPEIITPISEEEKPEVLDMIAMKRKIIELEKLVQQLLNK